MNITVEARHMEVTDAIRQYAKSKASRLPRYYDNVQSAEVILDAEADEFVVEIVVTAKRKSTFVATHRGSDMYASIDQCMDKVVEQLRRHKDKVRRRQGPPHSQTTQGGPA
ncbi:MAG: ribosome hibernation-promoting factor, HPF/YfiA family [Planctomycetota bacterium]